MIPIVKSSDNLDFIYKRESIDLSTVLPTVMAIIDDVKQRGDTAVIEYAKKFDKLSGENFTVSREVVEKAYNEVSAEQLAALKAARDNIFEFHKRTLATDCIETKNGITTGYVVRAVERAGIYVPGGKANYPSTVLMCAMAAKAAGVQKITMTTPCLSPLTLVAADICGVTDIYNIGGAQAIAAMAYGTDTVEKVDVISGPGNIYVTAAKKAVFGDVRIDLIAGPSEIVIIADDSANVDYVCQDLMSQAEHDELATPILLTNSEKLAKAVQSRIAGFIDAAPRKAIAEVSMNSNGSIVLCDSVDDAINVSNKIAPEHLELCVENASDKICKISNAGCIFLGNYTPEPVGDYYAGTNHVLPTGGTAKSFSGLSADNFIKKVNIVCYDKNALAAAANDIISLAETENLYEHAKAIKIRKGEK